LEITLFHPHGFPVAFFAGLHATERLTLCSHWNQHNNHPDNCHLQWRDVMCAALNICDMEFLNIPAHNCTSSVISAPKSGAS